MNNKKRALGGMERVMMLSGFLLAGFLTLHLCFNLTILCGEEIYNNAYRQMNTHPLLQFSVALFGVGFIVHILLAFFISAKGFYAVPAIRRREKEKWLNMLVPGVIVLGFGAIHLANFWQKTRLQHLLGRMGDSLPYLLVSDLFRQPFYVVIYLIWIVALWYHLSYGFWSLIRSLSSKKNGSIRCFRLLQWVTVGFSTFIAVGFSIIPLWFYFGFDK